MSNYENLIYQLHVVSDELLQLIQKQKSVISSLNKKYFGEVRIRDLYLNTKRDYENRLDLSKIIHEIDFNNMSRIIYKVSNLEKGFRDYDLESNPWSNRKNFAEINLLDNKSLHLVLEKLLDSLKDMQVLICNNDQEQQRLIDSLGILNAERGFPEKIESWTHALNFVKQTLKMDKFTDDPNEIANYLTMASKGKKIWTELEQLSSHLESGRYNELRKSFVEGNFDIMSEKLTSFSIALRESFWIP